MKRDDRTAQKGFTLVELLIVVIILAILAAIVVPQFATSTEDAKDSALDSSLANLRTALDLYYQQHGEYPGANTAVPTQACTGTNGGGALETPVGILEQLAYYTDHEGGSCSVKDDTHHKYGPYVKKKDLPNDPFTVPAVNTLAVANAGDLDMTADAGDPGGWKYDVKTGKLIVNIAAYETR